MGLQGLDTGFNETCSESGDVVWDCSTYFTQTPQNEIINPGSHSIVFLGCCIFYEADCDKIRLREDHVGQYREQKAFKAQCLWYIPPDLTLQIPASFHTKHLYV